MIVGDSNTLQYRYFFKFCTQTPTYEIAKAAIMAYGQEFASFKQGYYVPLNERQDFYNLYKKTLSSLKDGDKVILSSRWTIQYKNYLKEKNLLASDNTYSKYMDDIIKDIDEQIKKYPKLHFYIIGTAFCPGWEYINRTQLDLKDSLLEPSVIVQLVCDITFIFVNNLTFSFFKKKRGCGGEKETFFFTLPFASFPYQPLQIHCCPF